MSPFHIDMQTLVMILVAGNFISALTLLAYRNNSQSQRRYYQFMAGKFMQAVSWILIGLRGNIDYAYTVIAANAFIFAGFGLEALALSTEDEQRRTAERVFLVLTIAGTIISAILTDSPGYRVANASFIILFFYAAAAYRLFHSPRLSRLTLSIIIVFIFFCITLLFRGFYGLLSPKTFTVASDHPVHAITFFTYLFVLFGTEVCFILRLKEQDDRLLTESEEKFSSIFSFVPAPIVLSSMEDNTIVDVNPSYAKLCGYRSDEVRGLSIYDERFWHNLSERSEFAEKLQSKGMAEGAEYRFRKKNGEILTALLSSVVITLNNRKILLSSIVDITERKQAEVRLRMYSEELKVEKATRDKLYSIIAHDLRSPFQALMNVSRILSQEADDLTRDEIKSFCDGMYSSVKKQYNLVNDLLNWSKLQASEFTLKKETLNLGSIACEVISSLSLNFKEKEIEVRSSIPEDIWLFADHRMLKLVLSNLLGNALKFTRRCGSVEICAEKHEAAVAVTVSDTGIGIKSEDLEQLFRPEAIFSTPGTEDEPGSGLGLNLCREIVEKHGGHIRAESTPGNGSRFTFSLPATS